MADTETTAGGYESKSQTEAEASEMERGDAAFVKMWLDALDRAAENEKDWRKEANDAWELYRATTSNTRKKAFNIHFANVETLCPAIFNSTPVPDVRRRFLDEDPVGKEVADIIERALSFSVDSYDFDAVMDAVVKDGEVSGRGVPRVRYVPTLRPVTDETGQQILDEATGQPLEEVVYEEVACDYVPWKMFRRGPGRIWKDVPWVAFGDFLTKEELEKLAPDLAEDVPLNYSADEIDSDKKKGKQEQSIFRRALVWQIWDLVTRKVISVCPDYGKSALAKIDDPLGLRDFFPIPRPYQPILATDSLVPVVPYSLYQDLAEELNEVTYRIKRLVKQLRPRGGYGGQGHDIKAISEAGDGELVPLSNIEGLIQGAGIDKAITWFPMDPTVAALRQLVDQRDRIKQIVYEVTGIADILRGSTNPNETLGAQEIKAQWGSLRIQRRQSEVQRVARDLFRLKAEIIATKFSAQTISMMTGVEVSPEIEQVLRDDIVRSYRIDIESDSTIRADLARHQQSMANFLSGTAQYAQAMGGIVQQFPDAVEAVVEIYSAFARQYKLGRQAEAALDGMADTIRQAREQVQNQPPKPDPAIMEAEAKVEIERKRTDAEIADKDRRYDLDERKMVLDQIAKGVTPELMAAAMASQPDIAGKVDALVQGMEALGKMLGSLVMEQSGPVELVRDRTGQIAAIRKGETMRPIVRGPDGLPVGLGEASGTMQ